MKKDLVKYIFSLFAVCIGLLSNDIAAQQTKASGNSDNLNLAPTRKYKKARALQSSTAKKMAKVYEALEEVDIAVIAHIVQIETHMPCKVHVIKN